MHGAVANALPRGIEINEKRWPLVEMRIHRDVTVEDIDAAYDVLESIAKRGERHAHWTDLREIQPLSISPQLRKRFAERERRLFPLAGSLIVADVRIVDHPITRGLLTAFEWLVGETPWPVKNVGSDAEAIAWLREKNVSC
jgi:hypothetical protein